MSQKIKLTIDGKIVEANAGESLLQVAIDNGTMVPHFCYHPGIGIEGSCRLCLVQVEGMPKLATSCTVPVKDGMVVHTEAPEAKSARKSVLEFFLLNHPLDCPFCDKGGECPLQNFTLDSGQFTTRFEFSKIHKAKHEIIGEHIILDKERCVLCNRCVRFGRDLAGHEELQIGSRGSHAEIFVPEGEQLRSKFTGNYADICPVGALTSRSFRFKARPWEMKTENTTCGECSVGCNMQVWKKETQVLRLTPRIADDVNEWWLCDKGRFSMHQHVSPSRLKNIYKKTEQGWMESPVGEFTQFVKTAIKGTQPVGMVVDTHATNEEMISLKQIAAGNPLFKLFLPISSATFRFARALKGTSWELKNPSNLANVDTMVVAGENLEDGHPVLALRVRKLVKSKGKTLITAGAATSDLKDVRFADIDTQDAAGFFKALTSALTGRGEASKLTPAVQQAFNSTKSLCILVSDSWINAQTIQPLLELLEAAKNIADKQISFVHLVHGANARGLMDLAGDGVYTLDDLQKDVTHAAFGHVFWFASNYTGEVLDQLEKSGKLTAYATLQAHQRPHAQWLIPNESFLEKRGTYTNLFGKVQVLRKSMRVANKGEAVSEIIAELRNQLAGGQLDAGQLYQLVVKTTTTYPQTLEAIPESKETYHHYERALWR